MEDLSSREVWSFLPGEKKSKKVRGGAARAIPKEGKNGNYVANYRELARKVAELQFLNPEFILLFRGQGKDYPTTRKQSSIKPSIFRPKKGKLAAPGSEEIDRRYAKLRDSEQSLLRKWKHQKLRNLERLQRHRVLRWAILQHYEICGTPLLDVTHSLRIAASFATQLTTTQSGSESYLMVLAIPQLSGAVTVSADAELQALRLSSICPPEAERPHLQEGYLLGEYPDLADPDQKSYVPHFEVDFGRRLLAKFRIHPNSFWKGSDAFPAIAMEALLPSNDDPVEKVLATLRETKLT